MKTKNSSARVDPWPANAVFLRFRPSKYVSVRFVPVLENLHFRLMSLCVLSCFGFAFAMPALAQQPIAPLTAQPPVQMDNYAAVQLRALDKITARTTTLEVPVGSEVAFGTLSIRPQACRKTPPVEQPESAAFLQIWEGDGIPAPLRSDVLDAPFQAIDPEQGLSDDDIAVLSPEAANAHAHAQQTPLPAGSVFSGWMFASSPALSFMDHPIYDVWVLDCLGDVVEIEAPAALEVSPAEEPVLPPSEDKTTIEE